MDQRDAAKQIHPTATSPFSFDHTLHLKAGEENVITVKVNHQTLPSSRWYFLPHWPHRLVDWQGRQRLKDGVRVTCRTSVRRAKRRRYHQSSSTVLVGSGDADVAVSLSQTVSPATAAPSSRPRFPLSPAANACCRGDKDHRVPA